MHNHKLGIIGLGNLGISLSRLLIRNGFGNHLLVSDKNLDNPYLKSGFWTATNSEVINKSDIIFLCIKPNNIKDVINEINDDYHLDYDKLIISTAAGVDIEYIEKKLKGDFYPIMRLMPNIPIEISEGSIIYYGNNSIISNHELDLKHILRGPEFIEVKDEKLIDVGTILNGSMPAFLAHISDIYLKLGVHLGFNEKEFREIFISTLKGTGSMIENKEPEEIIKSVCSPNGVTEKGIKFLKENRIDDILNKSIFNSLKHLESIKKKLD